MQLGRIVQHRIVHIDVDQHGVSKTCSERRQTKAGRFGNGDGERCCGR